MTDKRVVPGGCMAWGVRGGFRVGERTPGLSNPIGGVEADRKLRGLPNGGGKIFDRSSTQRPLAGTPTNPKSGTLVRSLWSSGK